LGTTSLIFLDTKS